MNNMSNIYREFLPPLRKFAFEEVHILIHNDISSDLKNYVNRLINVKYTDGGYHHLYGNIKKIIMSFVIFFSDIIDAVIKKADKYTHVISRNELIFLTETTININQTSQAKFVEEYLPVTTPLEKEIYDDIDKKYTDFMGQLLIFKENLNKLDKQNKVDEFAKKHFKIAVIQMNKALNYTHGYLAMILVNRVDQIRVSLDEILLRLKNNLKWAHENYEDKISELLEELYDKNKDSLALARSYKRCSREISEVDKAVDIIRNKIEKYKELAVSSRLEEETAYWNKKLEQLEELRTIIVQIKQAQKENAKEEDFYRLYRTTELPGSKRQAFVNIGENIAKSKQYLEDKMAEISKCMITLFACRGNDRILYKDNIGEYYMDDFGHQVYVKNHYLEIYHVKCNGDFVNINEEAHFYDEHGRYIINKDDGSKVYQCAPCTSQYKLMDNGLLGKITKDCGHSETPNVKCRTEVKDLTDVEILPTTDQVNIQKTLTPEVVKYLWDSFGSVLPDALHDVGLKKSKNPIHHLAHMVIAHKYYNKTRKQLLEQTSEAEKYRSNIFEERKVKAIADTLAWKAKQVKRRKPEESDDALEKNAYEQHLALHAFINSLDYYN